MPQLARSQMRVKVSARGALVLARDWILVERASMAGSGCCQG